MEEQAAPVKDDSLADILSELAVFEFDDELKFLIDWEKSECSLGYNCRS